MIGPGTGPSRSDIPPGVTPTSVSLSFVLSLTRKGRTMPLLKADREARARQQHNVVFDYPDFGLYDIVRIYLLKPLGAVS